MERGSRALVQLLRNPSVTLLLLAAALGLVVFATRRTSWRPSAPLRVGRRRAWGQIVSAAGRMYFSRAPLFVGIGLLLIPVSLLIGVLQALVFGGFGLAGVETSGEGAGALVLLVAAVGLSLTLLGISLVQAATACALVHIDEGGSIGPVDAYRRALTQVRPLLGGIGIAVAIWVVLGLTVLLLPVAIWFAVRVSLLAQVVELEDASAVTALRRSSALVRGRWWRVASLVGLGSLIPLAVGPLLGAVLILVLDAPFGLANLVAGVINALAMPFIALVTAYVYLDARTRLELEPEDERDELPAELSGAAARS